MIGWEVISTQDDVIGCTYVGVRTYDYNMNRSSRPQIHNTYSHCYLMSNLGVLT